MPCLLKYDLPQWPGFSHGRPSRKIPWPQLTCSLPGWEVSITVEFCLCHHLLGWAGSQWQLLQSFLSLHRHASIGPWLISHVTYLSPPALRTPCSHWCMRLWGLLSAHMYLLPPKYGLRSCQQTCKHRSLLAFVTPLDTVQKHSARRSGFLGGLWKGRGSHQAAGGVGGGNQGLKSNGQVWLMEMEARRSMSLFPPNWVERLKGNQLHLWESIAGPRAPSLLFILPHFPLPPSLPSSLLSWGFPPNKGLANKPVPLAQFHREPRLKH